MQDEKSRVEETLQHAQGDLKARSEVMTMFSTRITMTLQNLSAVAGDTVQHKKHKVQKLTAHRRLLRDNQALIQDLLHDQLSFLNDDADPNFSAFSAKNNEKMASSLSKWNVIIDPPPEEKPEPGEAEELKVFFLPS